MIYNVDYFIKKFEAIPEDNWFTESYNNIERTKFCAMGHCGIRLNVSQTPEADSLTKILSNVPAINDGTHLCYQQPTPKQRILAALYDIKQLEAVKQAEDIINSPSQLQPC